MNKYRELHQIWENDFGSSYTDRKLENHEKEGRLREKFWLEIISSLPKINSVLEIGCNAGMNLEGIYNANDKLKISGIEPNQYALKKAKKIAKNRYHIDEGNIFNIPASFQSDLVITCTVLIHISPDDLIEAMKNVFSISSSYVLIMEYYWPSLKQVEYRGLNDALWKQDFGALFLNNFEVKLIETGFLDDRDGFDRTTWWLFKK